MKHEPRLDALRALAALLVIGMHCEYLLPFGWVGVQFFFVLSGFLVSGIIIDAKDGGAGRADFLRRFFTRRAARLFPLYFGYVGLLGIAWALCGQPVGFADAASALISYTFNFQSVLSGPTTSLWWAHLWSLAAEWQLYLVWPFLLWHLPARRRAHAFLALIALGPVLRLLTYMTCQHVGLSPGPNPHTAALDAVYLLPWSHLDAFALGALLHLPGWRGRLATGRMLVATVLALALGGMACVFWAVDRGYSLLALGWLHLMPDLYQWIWGYTLLNLFSACAIAGTLAKRNLLWRFADSRTLQYLGVISYGIYVFHLPTIALAGAWTQGVSGVGALVARLLIVLGLTICLAHLSHRHWERRFLKRPFAAPISAPPLTVPGPP